MRGKRSVLAPPLLCGQAGKGGAGNRKEFGPDRGMRGLLIAWDFHGESDFNENVEMYLVIDCSHGGGFCAPVLGIQGKSRNSPQLLSLPQAFLVLLFIHIVLNKSSALAYMQT